MINRLLWFSEDCGGEEQGGGGGGGKKVNQIEFRRIEEILICTVESSRSRVGCFFRAVLAGPRLDPEAPPCSVSGTGDFSGVEGTEGDFSSGFSSSWSTWYFEMRSSAQLMKGMASPSSPEENLFEYFPSRNFSSCCPISSLCDTAGEEPSSLFLKRVGEREEG